MFAALDFITNKAGESKPSQRGTVNNINEKSLNGSFSNNKATCHPKATSGKPITPNKIYRVEFLTGATNTGENNPSIIKNHPHQSQLFDFIMNLTLTTHHELNLNNPSSTE